MKTFGLNSSASVVRLINQFVPRVFWSIAVSISTVYLSETEPGCGALSEQLLDFRYHDWLEMHFLV